MRNFLFYSLLFFPVYSFSQNIDTIKLKSCFGQFVGGISIYDLNTNKCIRYNPEHCNKRFSPCSTFKIPNTLIGLQSGVIPDTSFIFKYDSIMHPKDSAKLANEPFKHWYQDLSLKMAFKYSCVWDYQELARNVGLKRMKKYVTDLNYGNKDISSGLDSFWLCGSLQISINEQIDFLKRLYLYKLNGFTDNNIQAVKDIMLNETTSEYKLYGKTGSGTCVDHKVIGWYVGFIETDSGMKIFAMNVIVNSYGDLKNNFQVQLTKKLLKELEIIN
jgi:Beta-lactamase class D